MGRLPTHRKGTPLHTLTGKPSHGCPPINCCGGTGVIPEAILKDALATPHPWQANVNVDCRPRSSPNEHLPHLYFHAAAAPVAADYPGVLSRYVWKVGRNQIGDSGCYEYWEEVGAGAEFDYEVEDESDQLALWIEEENGSQWLTWCNYYSCPPNCENCAPGCLNVSLGGFGAGPAAEWFAPVGYSPGDGWVLRASQEITHTVCKRFPAGPPFPPSWEYSAPVPYGLKLVAASLDMSYLNGTHTLRKDGMSYNSSSAGGEVCRYTKTFHHYIQRTRAAYSPYENAIVSHVQNIRVETRIQLLYGHNFAILSVGTSTGTIGGGNEALGGAITFATDEAHESPEDPECPVGSPYPNLYIGGNPSEPPKSVYGGSNFLGYDYPGEYHTYSGLTKTGLDSLKISLGGFAGGSSGWLDASSYADVDYSPSGPGGEPECAEVPDCVYLPCTSNFSTNSGAWGIVGTYSGILFELTDNYAYPTATAAITGPADGEDCPDLPPPNPPEPDPPDPYGADCICGLVKIETEITATRFNTLEAAAASIGLDAEELNCPPVDDPGTEDENENPTNFACPFGFNYYVYKIKAWARPKLNCTPAPRIADILLFPGGPGQRQIFACKQEVTNTNNPVDESGNTFNDEPANVVELVGLYVACKVITCPEPNEPIHPQEPQFFIATDMGCFKRIRFGCDPVHDQAEVVGCCDDPEEDVEIQVGWQYSPKPPVFDDAECTFVCHPSGITPEDPEYFSHQWIGFFAAIDVEITPSGEGCEAAEGCKNVDLSVTLLTNTNMVICAIHPDPDVPNRWWVCTIGFYPFGVHPTPNGWAALRVGVNTGVDPENPPIVDSCFSNCTKTQLFEILGPMPEDLE